MTKDRLARIKTTFLSMVVRPGTLPPTPPTLGGVRGRLRIIRYGFLGAGSDLVTEGPEDLLNYSLDGA